MAKNSTVAPALMQLFKELKIKFPNRKTDWDGTIGDKAHQARVSEHNPDKYGIVRAADFDIAGMNVTEFLTAVIGDSRVHYVIFNRKIYSRTYNWAVKKYNGASPHDKHIHVSLRNQTSEQTTKAIIDAAASNTQNWFNMPTLPDKPELPVVLVKNIVGAAHYGKTHTRSTYDYVAVCYVQRALNKMLGSKLTIDGIFGKNTLAVYKRYQISLGFVGIDADGIPGRESLIKLGSSSNLFSAV